MTKEEARKRVNELVDKYEQVKKSGQLKKYSEEDTKKGFIMPLFQALGWDFEDRNEVSSEEHVKSSGFIDYGFHINGAPQFYLEAKKLTADIHNEEFAKQAIRYSWNRGVTWAVLTDFESLIVFYAQSVSKHLGDKLYFEITYAEYLERFDELWRLSKEGFENNILDKDAERSGKKYQKISVTDSLYKDLNDSRELLLKSFSAWNKDKNIPDDLLEEGVQRFLDRLIFIRVAEDRKLENPILLPMLRAHHGSSSPDFFKDLIAKFRELDKIYNSNLFSKHPFEEWEEYSGDVEKVIEKLYGNPGYYEYDFRAIPADILGSVYENYLGYKLSQSDKGIAVAKDARKRKEQGIYYTPTYIVDYIVTNALKPVLDRCESVQDLKAVKVLDPACGSGSFLIRALEMIYEKYLEFGANAGEMTKITILLDNIFGVDLDDQAVEIARLNLLLAILDTRGVLPDLSKNIKNGNSLISGSDAELERYFGKNFRTKKPFSYKEHFSQIFNREKPGFDVIIGNPPWVSFGLRGSGKLSAEEKKYYSSEFQSSAEYKISVYALFMELGVRLINHQGYFSFIVPDSFLLGQYFSKIRACFMKDKRLKELLLLKYRVFEQGTAGAYVIFTIADKPCQFVGTSIVDSEEEFLALSGERFQIDIEYYTNLKLNRFRIFRNQNDFNLVRKIEEASSPLSAYIEFNSGLISKTGQQNIVSDTKDGDLWLPGLISGGEVHSYFIDSPSHYLHYKKEDIKSGYSNIDYTAKKVFLRQTGDSLIAAVDTDELLALNNIHIGSPKDKNTGVELLRTIVAILNSKMMNRYYKLISLEEGRTMAQTDIETVEQLPVHQLIDKDIQQLNVLSKTVTDLKRQLRDEPSGSNKELSLKSEIEKNIKQIDHQVYQLYRLTPEEIESVES